MSNNSNFLVFQTMKDAWQVVKGAKKVILIVVFLQLLVGIVFRLFEYAIAHIAIPLWLNNTLLISFNIAENIIHALLGWALLYFSIQRAAYIPIQISMLKNIFNINLIWKMIRLTILYTLLFLPIIITMFLPAAIKFIEPEIYNQYDLFKLYQAISYLFSVIAFVWIFIRTDMASAIVLTHKINSWDAIKLSFKATKCKVWKLIGFNLAYGSLIIALITPFTILIEYRLNYLCILIGIGTVLIALIWIIPYLFILQGMLYQKLVVNNLVISSEIKQLQLLKQAGLN